MDCLSTWATWEHGLPKDMGRLCTWTAKVHGTSVFMDCLSTWTACVHGLPKYMGRLCTWTAKVHGLSGVNGSA